MLTDWGGRARLLATSDTYPYSPYPYPPPATDGPATHPTAQPEVLRSSILSEILAREAGAAGMDRANYLQVEIRYHPDSYEHPYTVTAHAYPKKSPPRTNAQWQIILERSIEKAARHGWISRNIADYILEYMYPDYNRCRTVAQRGKLYRDILVPALRKRSPGDAIPTLSMACRLLLGSKLQEQVSGFVAYVDEITRADPLLRRAITLLAARALLGTSLADRDNEWGQYSYAATKALIHLYTNYTNMAHLGSGGQQAREAHARGELTAHYQQALEMSATEASCLGTIVGRLWDRMNRSDMPPSSANEDWKTTLRQAMSHLERIPNVGRIKTKVQGAFDDDFLPPNADDFYTISAPAPNATWAYLRIDGPGQARKPYKALKRLYPPTSTTDAKHMSTQVDAILYQYINGPASYKNIDPDVHSVDERSSRIRQLNEILKFIPIGTNSVLTIAMTLTTLCSKSSLAVQNLYIRSRLLVRDSNNQKDQCKALGSYIRKSAHSPNMKPLTPEEVAATTYYELCFGRSLNVSDWEAEKRNRTATVHHIASPKNITVGGDLIAQCHDIPFGTRKCPDQEFYAKLRKTIMGIIPPLYSKLRITEPFKRFYGRRNDWISSGSSGGYKSPTLGKILGGPGGTPIAVDKRVWAEEHDYKHIVKSMKRSPREVSRASEKYENGKSRAIYGVAPEHYVINTYVTQGMEERLHKIVGLEKGAEGIDEMAYVKMRCNITQDDKQECVMLDYADFNIQHTLEAQWILFDCLLDQGILEGACDDWIDACKWIRDAKKDQRITFPQEAHSYKVTQGMFSGTRSTDLINTILNLAYFRIANDHVENGGCHATDMYHVHQGDDVWLSSTNKLWGARLYYTMREQGYTFQQHKQMFGPCRGEYLRVLYDHGRATGYLARSLANYLLHSIYNRMDLGGIEWIRSVSDTVRVLQRRGLDLYGANCIWQDIVHYRGLIENHSGDRKPVAVPRAYIIAPVECGGMGCPPPGTVPISGPIPEAPNTELVTRIDTSLLAHRMAKDWVSHVSSILPRYARHIRADALERSIKENSYSSTLHSRGKIRYSTDHKRRWSDYKRRLGEMRRPPQLRTATELRAATRLISASCGSRHELGGSGPLTYVTAALDCNTLRPGTAQPWLSVTQTLNKYITQSTFKSTSKTSLALGLTKTDALMFILQETVDRSRANTDVISMVTQLVQAGKIDWVERLLKGGSSVLTPLAQYSDAKFINYFGSMLHQVLVLASLRQSHHYLSEMMSDHSHYIALYTHQLFACGYKADTILY